MSLSLSSLNSPTLVSSGMAGLAIGLPKLETLIVANSISFTGVKSIIAASYAVNLFAVSVPGRLDGENQSKFLDENDENTRKDSLLAESNLLTPAGWAFAIWGPIFAGELVLSISQLFLTEPSIITPILKEMAAPFAVGQLFQSLWCASFRPKYEGSLMLISTAGLTGAAYSLSKVHGVFSSLSGTYSTIQYLVYFLPTSLHFGWLTAAALVNLNAGVTKMTSNQNVIATVGHSSVLAATTTSIYITLTRSAPVYGGVISWALFAVADGMRRRLAKSKKDDEDLKKLSRAVFLQKRLSILGALVSLGASIYSSISMLSKSNET